MSVVCVVGGGPAGSSVAARLAMLGHEVWLVERTAFPRRRLGEALTPGVLPLLEETGAWAAVEAAHVMPLDRVAVDWELGPQLRALGREAGFAVSRGPFDRALLEHARALGVRVLQPASLVSQALVDDHWQLEITAPQGGVRLQADLLVEATGRSGSATTRTWQGPPTLALHAWWPGHRGAPVPTIEARRDGWFWGVPLPDGTYNTLAFVEARKPVDAGDLRQRFLQLLGSSTLPRYCRGTPDRIEAINATPYLDRASAMPRRLKVGDCALALDPLSSSGVQKAIRGALAAAVVANTLLRRPADQALALQFYRTSLEETSRRHAGWAAGHYARAAGVQDQPFWQRRSVGAHMTGSPLERSPDAATLARLPLGLSSEARILELPCLDGDFVTMKRAISHPALDGPLAYLGGHEVVPLMLELEAGQTVVEIARRWARHVPIERGIALAHWMLSRGVLVARGGCA